MRLTHCRTHCRLSSAVYNSTVFTGRRHLTPRSFTSELVFARSVRPVAATVAGFSTSARVFQQTTMSATEDKPEAIGGQPAECLKTEAPKPKEEELPPLSDHEFRVYNRLADKMEYFVR